MSVLSYLLAIAEEVKIQNWERTKIDTSINTLSYKLNNHFNNLSSKYVFGSYDRKTILRRSKDNNSDVDFMVVFSDGANYKPQTLMNRLKGFVEANYSRNEIYQSSPTIVLELSHIKFELVPAYSSWLSTYIPAPSSQYGEWITSDPSLMKTALNSKNSSNYHMMRKLIRILKYWNAKNGKVFSSYALEKSIVETYYWGCSNLRDYFYTAVESLSTYNLSIYSASKINFLKSTCKSAKKLETENYPYSAQTEIEKLFT